MAAGSASYSCVEPPVPIASFLNATVGRVRIQGFLSLRMLLRRLHVASLVFSGGRPPLFKKKKAAM